MVHRDPQTGQFVAGGGSYDDVETMSFLETFRVNAVDLDGTAGSSLPQGEAFEGWQILDLDEVLDRHERAELISADHHLEIMAPSTRTADGTVACSVEVSGSPSRAVAYNFGFDSSSDLGGDNIPIDARGIESDTMDLIGRPMAAITGGPFSDGASGVGGSNAGGTDEVDVQGVPGGFELDGRDELYINGAVETSNIADGGIVFRVAGQHHYGVIQD